MRWPATARAPVPASRRFWRKPRRRSTATSSLAYARSSRDYSETMAALRWRVLLIAIAVAMPLLSQDQPCNHNLSQPLEKQALDAMHARDYPLAERRFTEAANA